MKHTNGRSINYIFIILSLILFAAAFTLFRPVPIVSEAEAIVQEGIVAEIYEGGVKDVVFRFENDSRKFYINRGLEKGLTLESLRNKLIGNRVVIKYPEYWSLSEKANKHISKLEFGDEVIFNELK